MVGSSAFGTVDYDPMTRARSAGGNLGSTPRAIAGRVCFQMMFGRFISIRLRDIDGVLTSLPRLPRKREVAGQSAAGCERLPILAGSAHPLQSLLSAPSTRRTK